MSRPSRFVRRKPVDPATRRDEALAFTSSDETWRPPDWFERIAVVLVETTDPVNVGGVVRSMANMGFLRLRLVNPVDFDPWAVVGVAHYTQHILEATPRFERLPEAVADRQFVVGLTGRHHRVERNALAFQTAMDRVAGAAVAGEDVALVFGRGDWGMSHAMLLVLYQLFQRANGEEQAYRPPRRHAPRAPSELLEDLYADLERALLAIDFLGKRSRTSAMRSLRVALFRAGL